MPILQISDLPFPMIVQQCTECAATVSVPRASLVLGVAHEHEASSDPNLIELPPCVCGAQEFLNQTFDVAPDNMADHRKKVNALAVHMKAAGQLHPKLAEQIKADKRTPAQVGDLIGSVPVRPGLASPKLADGITLVASPAVPSATDHAVEILARVLKEPKRKAAADDPQRAVLLKSQLAIVAAMVRKKPLAPDPAPAPAPSVASSKAPAPAAPEAFAAMPSTEAPVVSVSADVVKPTRVKKAKDA